MFLYPSHMQYLILSWQIGIPPSRLLASAGRLAERKSSSSLHQQKFVLLTQSHTGSHHRSKDLRRHGDDRFHAVDLAFARFDFAVARFDFAIALCDVAVA